MTIPQSAAPAPEAIRAALDAAAAAAQPLTLGYFRTHLSVDNKHATGFDPVTEADRSAETAIRDIIARHFPEHAIIGEEWAHKDTGSDYTWIVDPIDGTRAFISGVPVWGTLIGLNHKGRAIAGLMAQPFTGETWTAVKGQSTYRRGDTQSVLKTGTATQLATARAATTAPELFTGPYTAGWHAIRDRVLQTRYGLDCYGYALLASGHIDLVIEAGLKDVDIAPLVPIIEGAGGVVTTWDGRRPENGGTCIATATPELHEEAMDVLREAMLG